MDYNTLFLFAAQIKKKKKLKIPPKKLRQRVPRGIYDSSSTLAEPAEFFHLLFFCIALQVPGK